MNILDFFLKNRKETNSSEHSYIQGFSSGFSLGIQMASTVDEALKTKIINDTYAKSLESLNGNHKKNN